MDWWFQFSEVMRNVGLVVGGAFGLFLAWQRVTAANQQAEASIRQAELARRGHFAELFNRAVGQLQDAKLEIRLGAIYTLRQIGDDFPDLSGAVFELLSEYMRQSPANYGDLEPPADIREIVQILKRQLENSQ